MNGTVVLLAKARRTRATWNYVVGSDHGTLTGKDEDLLAQMAKIVDMFVSLYEGEQIAVVSPQLVTYVRRGLQEKFPEIPFIPLTSDLYGLFDRAFNQPSQRRRDNTNTLYVCSDASGGHMGIPAAWAWCSSGVNSDYGIGFSGRVNTNVAELEGLMSAIIAHEAHPASRVHVYSDSSNAVDDVASLAKGIMPKSAILHGLTDLGEQTAEVMARRKVSVEWVRGHRQHRLNSMADSMSRFARHQFTQGKTLDQFTQETDALHAILDLSA